MKGQRLLLALLIAPFIALLVATKVSVWLSGKELLADSGALGQFLWVSIGAGIVVFLIARSIVGFSLFYCVVSGIVVFGLIDLINLTGLVHIYKENIATEGLDPAVGLAKLVGGALYGIWFWLFDPFKTDFPRNTMGRTLRRGGDPWA